MPTRARGRAKPRKAPGRPKLKEALAIEEWLLSVALREFVKCGYGEASMTQIAKAAGASKTTLYSRYPTKERLFRAIIRQQIARLDVADVLRPGGKLPSLAEGLKAYANQMLELSQAGDILDVNRLIFSESSRFPELGAAAIDRTALGIERIAGFIRERALKDGILCKNPHCVAELFIFAIRGWYLSVMLNKRRVTRAERERWVECSVSTLLAGRTGW